MQAIIMAGGEGSRLKPLTCDIPKPLAPLCGRPVIEYILELLEKYNFSKATLTLMYKGEQLVKHFESGKYGNIDIDFAFEDKPLGTAGSVKNALPSDYSDDFIVISGDAMCDFDLSKAVNFHKKNKSLATIILKKVSDPREYGLVNIDQTGKIEKFIEKPSYANCSCDTANTGIYILSHKILEFIDQDKSVDFSMDIFPKLLEKEIPIYGYVESGYWCDIGDFESYIKCQKDILLNKVKCNIKANYHYGIYYKGEFPQGEFNVDPPVYIGENVNIGENAFINSGTVIGDNVTIGENTRLNQTIILNSTYMSDNIKSNNSVICSNAKILRSSSIFEGSVIGSDAIINEHCTISNGSKVWNSKVVPKFTTLTQDLKYGYPANISFDDDGICGELNTTITPTLCNKIGSAIASLKKAPNIAVATNNEILSLSFKYSLISGIIASSGNVFDFKENIESQFDFCVRESEADFGVYLEFGKVVKIKIVQRGGLPLIRTLERKIESFINKDEYFRANSENFGKLIDMSSLNQLYPIILKNNLVAPNNSFNININCKDKYTFEMLSNSMKTAGYNLVDENFNKTDISIYISNSGKSISMYSEETGYVFYEKLITLACLSEFIQDNDVAIPYNAPRIINKIAQNHNKKVYRYYNSPYDTSDVKARDLSLKQPFLKDCLLMSIKILNFLNQNNYTLEQAISLIPHFSVSSRVISLGINPNLIINKLNQKGTSIGEGIELDHENGEVLIRPLKSGEGLILFAESVKSESANEICDFFEDLIKKNVEK